MGIFNIEKGTNNQSNNSRFINPNMQGMPDNDYSNNMMGPNMQQQNNETFVYNSVPKQELYNQNGQMNNGYPNNMNNQQYANQGMNDMMPRTVQAPNEVVNQANMESLEELDFPEFVDTPQVEMDPLNNANNPIPVNPVAPVETYVEEELPENVKANIFSVIGMMFGMITKPGTTIIKNSKKYKSFNKAIMVTLLVGILSVIICMAARMVVGCFSVSYDAVTGASKPMFNMNGLFDINNYVPYITVSLVMSYGSIVVSSLVYYASSFLNSKGIPIGTYFMVSSLAMVPLIIGVLALFPIAAIFSGYFAVLIFVFTFMYTLISFFIGMNEILTFESIDKRILYNIINLSIIFVIIVLIFMLLFRVNILTPPELHL